MRGLTLGDPALLGAAAGFSPASLSPILWLDASDTATITSSGGAVSQWNNKGSLGNFAQATSIYQPTTGTVTQNGLNVLSFTGDYLLSNDAASAYNSLHDGTNYIVAALFRMGATSNPNALYLLMDNSDAGSSNRGFSVFYDDRSSVPRNDRIAHSVSRAVTGAFAVSNLSADNAFTPNAFHTVTLLADPDNGTAADRSAIFVDSAAAIKNNTLTGAPSTSNATFQLFLGALASAPTTFNLTGAIAEVIVVTGANATETNRATLHTYLRNKWGL